MSELSVLNPVADTNRPKVESAIRLNDLTGKSIGLFWNGKSGGDILLQQSAELLKQRVGGIKFKNYGPHWTAAERFDIVAKECDAIIEATAD